MGKWYVISFFIITLAICVYAYFFTNKYKKSFSARVMKYLLITSFFTGIFYLFSLIFNNYQVTEVFITLYIASMGYLSLSLGIYLLVECKVIKKTGKKFLIFYGIVTLDCISVILNLQFHHMLTFTKINNVVGNYLLFNGSFIYTFHLIICYLPILVGVVFTIIMAIITPKYYRRRYINILIVISILVLSNLIFLVSDLTIDLTIGLYGIASLVLTFLGFVHVPNKLKETLSELLVENSNMAIIYYDIDKNKIISNDFYNIWSERLKLNYELFIKFFEDAKRINSTTREKELITIYDAKKYYFRCQAIEVNYINKKGKSISLGEIFNALDNTESVELNLNNQHKLTHDELTDLYNFNYFSILASQIIKSNTDTKYLFIVNDLKQFKMYNQIMGKEAGDRVIIGVSNLLRNIITDSKVIYCRINSDRFGVFGPKASLDNFSRFIDISKYLNITNYKLINCIGVYNVENNNESIDDMYQKALIALDEAKNNQITNYCIYNNELIITKTEEINVINEFNYSLNNNEFEVYLQPQFNAISKEVTGGEALVRRIKNGKIISPADFIPVLESTGLITKLDCFVWDKTCQMLVELINKGFKGSLSVNVSAQDIFQMDIVKHFVSLSKKYRFEPKKIRIEITESYVVENLEKYSKLISDMNSAGFLVEMDDFGSGYSSLNTLKDTPVNALKLDMRFLENSKDIERSKKIIKSIVDMAKTLSTPLIAEGVETEEQYEYLKSINCDYIQGYLLGKPMPFDAYKKLIKID